MPKAVEKMALDELQRLTKMMPYSPEATVVRTYLDWLVAMPWQIKTEDKLNIREVKKILEEDHWGLKKPKERILEYLAVCKLNKKIKGPNFMLCRATRYRKNLICKINRPCNWKKFCKNFYGWSAR